MIKLPSQSFPLSPAISFVSLLSSFDFAPFPTASSGRLTMFPRVNSLAGGSVRRTVELAAHSYHQMNGTEDYVARALQGVTQSLSTMSNPTLTTQISLPSQLSVPQAHEKSLCFEVLGPVHSLQRSQIYFVPKVSRSSTANGARSLPQLKTSFL